MASRIAHAWPVYSVAAKYLPDLCVATVHRVYVGSVLPDAPSDGLTASCCSPGSMDVFDSIDGWLSSSNPMLLMCVVLGCIMTLKFDSFVSSPPEPPASSSLTTLTQGKRQVDARPVFGTVEDWANDTACTVEENEKETLPEDCFIHVGDRQGETAAAQAIEARDREHRAAMAAKDEEVARLVEERDGLRRELEHARHQLVERDQQLEEASQIRVQLEAALKDSEAKVTATQSAFTVEVETLEAMLDEAQDHAGHIVKHVKKRGCPLDTECTMRSGFAKDALNGKSGGDPCILVSYKGSLKNPVGAMVYEHDQAARCTKIIAAFAAPKRGTTKAAFEAVKESARRQGHDRLVLDAVSAAIPFWEHLGFTTDAVQGVGDCVQMSMPLCSGQ
eukprot:gb/GFBE01001222.1/.p1 GENE.gb/GFBE01001222.1/~~gb/GFBE01001222.1/.p1  ORF type:complete len:390 (+),score=87.02 gb/GFBE01001222.1/:1-1170(+)